MMIEIQPSRIMDMTVQEVSDLLERQLCENRHDGKEYSCLQLKGTDPDTGERQVLTMVLRGDDIDED